MRKLVVSEFVSLDGVIENPDWTWPFNAEEQQQFKFDELKAADALLLGRVTYEGFAAAWPNMTEAGGEYAERMNNYPKYVVSKTLNDAVWKPSYLIKGNVCEEVAKLKEKPGKDILIFGSADLVNELHPSGLIDEYRLMIFPVIVGTGKKLFKDGLVRRSLKLVKTKTFRSGVAVLIYRKEEG